MKNETKSHYKPGPRAKEIIERHNKVILSTTMVPYPLVGYKAKGDIVEDVDGNSFIDFSSAVAVTNIGYNHPKVVEAINTQAYKLTHFAGNDFYNELQVELAEKLVQITPGNFEKKVFFSNSGAESVECAFKMARWKAKKPGMISFLGAFHGRTFGALSLSACKAVQKKHYLPLVPSVMHVPFAYCYRCPYGMKYPECDMWCASYIEEVFLHHYPKEDIAALIVEPIQGEAGYIVPPIKFHLKLQKICHENNLIFIMDEVQAGFGRTGKMFASELFNVQPDIICLAKGLSGGIPIGATVAKSDTAEWSEGSSSHSNTYGGNALACAASLAKLEVMQNENIAKKAAKLGEYALKRLEEFKEKSSIVGDVRGKGLMIGIEFVKDKETKEKAIKETDEIAIEAFKNGLILLPVGDSCIRIAPPLNISQENLDKGLEIIFESTKAVEGG